MLGYSYKPKDEGRVAKAIGREVKISPKFSAEICRELRGRKLDEAKKFLEEVIAMQRPVPLRRYKKGVAHRKGLRKAYTGRYPVKAAFHILKVLNSAEANADYKGLNSERLYVKHISAQRGRIQKRFRPRAFGRASASHTLTSNIEVILEER